MILSYQYFYLYSTSKRKTLTNFPHLQVNIPTLFDQQNRIVALTKVHYTTWKQKILTFVWKNVLLYVGVSEVNARGKTYNLILAHMEYMDHVQENGEKKVVGQICIMFKMPKSQSALI